MMMARLEWRKLVAESVLKLNELRMRMVLGEIKR